MLAALIAFLFGIAEAFLLKKILFSYTNENYIAAVLFLLAKLAAYGIAIPLLVFVFSDYVINCAIGFAFGMPAAVVLWFAFKALHKGGDKVETDNDN